MEEVYVGLDVSDRSTHECLVDGWGVVIWSGACATDPEVIARTLAARAKGLARAVLETGALSAFLYHGLLERGVRVVCVCARHAKGGAGRPGEQERPTRRRRPDGPGGPRPKATQGRSRLYCRGPQGTPPVT
jgi:transposase